ncbi:MAG TPA: hypothetical protein P5207_06700 [Candidatus Sabulitectum sp.]|nr:hypothetical protein [Candidatus Sabulitectum sp.]
MAITVLSPGRRKKLSREAGGDRTIMERLCRESLAREWLRNSGIPSWRNPLSPVGPFPWSGGRYSLMLGDGSRFLVCGGARADISFDAVAAAKCFAVLGMNLADDMASGEPAGFTPIWQMERTPGILPLELIGTPEDFIRTVRHPRKYTTSLLGFSARLLILGEPVPPAWETVKRLSSGGGLP